MRPTHFNSLTPERAAELEAAYQVQRAEDRRIGLAVRAGLRAAPSTRSSQCVPRSDFRRMVNASLRSSNQDSELVRERRRAMLLQF